MKKQTKYKYIVVLQGMFDGQWEDLVTYDKEGIQERKNDIRDYRESDPRPYRFVNRREPNPDYDKDKDVDDRTKKLLFLNNLKCCTEQYIDECTDIMKNKFKEVFSLYGPSLVSGVDEDSITANHVACCIIAALLQDQIHDFVGDLNDKSVGKEERKLNMAMKRLIEQIYATL